MILIYFPGSTLKPCIPFPYPHVFGVAETIIDPTYKLNNPMEISTVGGIRVYKIVGEFRVLLHHVVEHLRVCMAVVEGQNGVVLQLSEELVEELYFGLFWKPTQKYVVEIVNESHILCEPLNQLIETKRKLVDAVH
jgi:hypothetical protein